MMEHNRKQVVICYMVVCFLALLLGMLFELYLGLMILMMILYASCVPQLLGNQRTFAYETQRFHDINSYMSQMSQSFIYTQDVIASLEETYTCFPQGLMKQTLEEALELIELGKWDIKRAERDALLSIEKQYDCERLRNLHAFFLDAEELGGECHKEFQILERMRIAWQSVVEEIRVQKLVERNVGTMIYLFFLLIGIAMLRIMRNSDLDIMGLWATQLVNVVLLIGGILYFRWLDRRLAEPLLINPKVMTEEQVQQYFAFLEQNPKGKALRQFQITSALKKEIGKAFPKWLFHMMLLLQRESVEAAMEHSIKTAPPVLKRELVRITGMLARYPHNPEAYMSFLQNLGTQSMREIMHKLYSLAVGVNRDSEVLDVVMEKNIQALERSERDSMLFQQKIKSILWVPFLVTGFGMMGYLVIAIVTSINGIIQLI